MDLSHVSSVVQDLIKEVGTLQKQHFRGASLEVQTKKNTADLVTKIDLKSEQMILQRLEREFPGTAFLCEESGSSGNISDMGYRWVIDPLDGTTNYAEGVPIFAISIGLEHGADKVKVFGAVYAPMLDELYVAVKGQGATCNGAPIKVSCKSNMA